MVILHQACCSEKDLIVKYLCDNLAGNLEEINRRDNFGRTALHFAASTGNLNICQMLIQAGADLNAISIGGETAIMKAA